MYSAVSYTKFTYELEGDRLEILLVYERIESLRAFGRQLSEHGGAGVLPNLDATIRKNARLIPGMEIEKDFPGFGRFRGTIQSSEMVDSTIYPGKERLAYKVLYPSDGSREDLEDEEIRPLLVLSSISERAAIVEALVPAFEYLESRINGTCHSQYDCSHMYQVCVCSRLHRLA